MNIKTLLLLVGSALCLSAEAQLQPSDTTGCAQFPTPVPACFDSRLPARHCVADIELALKALSAWEQCVADQMQERHAKERRELVERTEQRRASLLQSIQLMSR